MLFQLRNGTYEATPEIEEINKSSPSKQCGMGIEVDGYQTTQNMTNRHLGLFVGCTKSIHNLLYKV